MELTDVWQDYGLSQLEETIGQFFPQNGFSARETFGRLLSGDVWGALGGLAQGVVQTEAGRWDGLRSLFAWLILLGVLSAVLSHFVEIFDHRQIADFSFYFVYLILMTILIGCVRQIGGVAETTLDNLTSFVQMLLPTYLMAVGLAGGSLTVGVGNQLMMLLIYLVENLLKRFVSPLIYGYVMLALLSGIWPDEKLALLLELTKKGVSWILKGTLGAVMGMSIFQSLLTPALDSVRSGAVQRAVGALPGVGNTADGMMEMAVGSAVVIKNSVGVLFLILLLAICAVPLLRIFVTAALLKTAAAVMGMVSDRRITLCTDRVATAGLMFLRATATALLLFVMVVALIAATTNRGF